MIKYFAAFLLLLTLSTGARAQYSQSYIGVRLGATFAGQTTDSTTDGTTNSLKFGPIVGAQYDHWFDDMWGIGIGLLFNQKGSHEEYSPGSLKHIDTATNIAYVGTDDFSLSYLEIPIVLKAAFGDGSVRPYLFFGPSIGILLSASQKSGGNIPAITDLKTSLNTVDISLYFGAGIMDKLDGGTMLFFDAGYAAGLTKVYKSQPDRSPLPDPIDHSGSKSSDIRVAIGMMWPM